MAKQTVSTSTDRWQQGQAPRGSNLLPLPAHNQTSVISPSGVVSAASLTATNVHHHPTAYQTAQRQQSQQQHQRKKSGGSSGVCMGLSGGGGQPGRDGVMFAPGGNSVSESKDRQGGRTAGASSSHQHSSHGPSDITANVLLHQHDLETLDCSRNPLLCLICNNIYEDPRLLSCYHTFCAKCLPGRLGDPKIVCPLCGKPTALKDGSGPPTDHLLRFLLHTSSDVHPSCANCDNKSRAPMYYCNTCGQVLCNGCREETHRAKMFDNHKIIPVSKHMKETPKKVCYRDTAMENRLHCVDLETAYNQGCRKLDRAVMSLRDLQVAVRESITKLKNVLEELRRNSDSEKSAVNAVCQTILDALTKTQENLLKDVDCQMERKDKVIRGQLCQLRSVLPTIKLHLTMCTTIANATNKYDFLDLAYPLIDRLTAITHMGYPIRPGQNSQIKTTYKTELARTLEPWVFGAHHTTTASGVTYASAAPKSAHTPKDFHPSADPCFGEPTYSQYYPMSRSTVTPTMAHKSYGGGGGYAAPTGIGVGPSSSGRKTPVSKSKVADEHFAAHCRSFTAHVNELNQRLNRLKEQVQELHRDITHQRGRAEVHSARAETAMREGLFLEDQLERRHAEMERIRKHLETTWNDSVRQIRMEQEVFQSQMNNLVAMKSEVKQLSSLLHDLQSFLKSLLSVHPPLHQQPGGSGPSGASGGGGGGSGGMFSGTQGKSGGPAGTSSGQGGIHHGQSNRQQQHVQHLTTAPDTFSCRVESGSQVTPSLAEMQTKSVGIASQGPILKSDPNRLSGRSVGGIHSFGPLTAATTSGGGLSVKQSYQAPQQGFSPRPTCQPNQPSQAEMEYIHVDTSYSNSQAQHAGKVGGGIGRPFHGHGLGSISEASMKNKGVLSQLINKVRLKDSDRKKSYSGVSSSSSGGTIPKPEIPSTSADRRALTMYDAQCQFGLNSSTSAVSALAPVNFNRRADAHEHESRPTTPPRTNSYIKSKSDDERPTSKLSQQPRARSVGHLDTETLLKSLSDGGKNASMIVQLYESLSHTIMDQKNMEELKRQAYPEGDDLYAEQPYQGGYRQDRDLFMGGQNSPKLCNHAGQSNSLGRLRSHRTSLSSYSFRSDPNSTDKYHRSRYVPGESEDDYQQLAQNRTFPMARSHSAPPRKPSQQQQPSSNTTAAAKEVKVYIHQEPRSSRNTRSSSPSATLSKSLEESYLYDYFSQQQHSGGHITPSSSGQSGFGNGIFISSMGKKPSSSESLISGGAEESSGQSRKSSVDFDRRSVVTVRRAGSKSALITRQHSWEAAQLSGKSLSTPQLSPTEDPFESGRSSSVQSREGTTGSRRSRIYDDDDLVVGNTLHKADSFEGHEEAVKSIVAAVQETRTLQRVQERRLQSN